jgi:(E)-4-hydroxy-3-methyl-but-2-enyl pyrophosphate reductase
LKTVIDSHAGPCPGVRRALRLLEQELRQHDGSVALGDVIHNPAEVARLEAAGLKTVGQEQVEQGNFDDVRGRRVFIRSHGVSEQLLRSLEQEKAVIIDATCSTVAKIQKKIRSYFEQGYQILIVGKAGHPEVKGLKGYCQDQAVIISSESDFNKIDGTAKSLLVAQTTVDPSLFKKIGDQLKERLTDLTILDTTCRQVSQRHQNIRNFASEVDVVLLVGGKNSSNTQVLLQAAREINQRTFWIESSADLKKEWFLDQDTIGITGSASTPMWQLYEIQHAVESIDSAE